MTTKQIIEIGLLLILLEIGTSLLISIDLTWYVRILNPFELITSTVVFSVILTILSIVAFGLFRIKRKIILNYWRRICTIGIILSFCILLILSTQPIHDMNDVYEIQINNVKDFWLWDNDTYDMILRILGDENITSDQEARVYFWYNTSYLPNVTMLTFWYNNDTSRDENETMRFLENGFPNRDWWTDNGYFFPDSFGNGSYSDMIFQSYRIPEQESNTTVEYIIVIRVENASGAAASRPS